MSTMTYAQAANEVRKMLRGFQAIQEVSDALDSVGSLENASNEAQARLDAAEARCAELATMKQDAEKQAAELVATAKAQADEIKEAAKTHAATIKAKAARVEQESMEAKSKAEAEVAAMAQEVKKMLDDIATHKLELESVIKSRDEIKAQMQSMFK